MSVIELKDVSYHDILKNISGEFYKNKITALVGPSGAGKSTTLRHLNGLLSPTKGEVWVYNKNILDYDIIKLRKTIGMAFQSSPMIEGNVYDNLKLPRDLFKESLSEEEAKALLERVELNVNFLERNVRHLSGGEKSRVALARTLVNAPKVLLLDEITASLDYSLSREIERLIVKLKNDHDLTIVWVTHNLYQARRVADDVWFLKDGKLIETGAVSILDYPRTKALERFARSENE